jgi:hypothetical protein
MRFRDLAMIIYSLVTVDLPPVGANIMPCGFEQLLDVGLAMTMMLETVFLITLSLSTGGFYQMAFLLVPTSWYL